MPGGTDDPSGLLKNWKGALEQGARRGSGNVFPNLRGSSTVSSCSHGRDNCAISH